MTNDQIDSLAKFALEILEEFPDLSSYDGGDLQDLAVKHKLLVPQTVYAPCSEECCSCAEYYSDEEFKAGVTCYHIADWLDRQPEQRNEADSGIPAATNNSTMMECGNCGVPRFVHDGALEKCPNCGDDEFDLSLMGDAP